MKKREMLPNFLIVGAPKAGTTSLYRYLGEHPQVYMSPVKEPNFFSYEEIESQGLYYSEKGIRDLTEYQKLFAEAAGRKAIGEASVSYLWYPETAKKIKGLIPGARIIMVLRNPIDRGFSHYLMDRRLQYVRIPFEDIAYRRTSHKLLSLYFQQYVELGLYYEQVKRYLDHFDREQVKIFLFEDLKNMEAVIRELFAFLEIDGKYSGDVEKRYNTYIEAQNAFVGFLYSQKFIRGLARSLASEKALSAIRSRLFEKKDKPVLDAKTRDHLAALYLPDILKLEGLIGRDLSGWRER